MACQIGWYIRLWMQLKKITVHASCVCVSLLSEEYSIDFFQMALPEGTRSRLTIRWNGAIETSRAFERLKAV